jgi:hypothetical protein
MSLRRVLRSGLTVATTQDRTPSLFVASGIPAEPTGLTQTTQTTTTASLSWTAPSYVGDSGITSYVLSNTAAAGSISYSGTTAVVSGLTANTSYTWSVYAINAQGRSADSASITASTAAYNSATGGSTLEFARSGLGNWRSHTFTSPGTFSITGTAFEPFSVTVLSGGAGGGYSHPADPRGPGAPGPARESTSINVSSGNVSVTVGGGGGGGTGTHDGGQPGGTSSFGAFLSSSGGGSVTNNFRTGSNLTWAGNGYGGGGAACYLCTGGTGQAGIVFAAYRIS